MTTKLNFSIDSDLVPDPFDRQQKLVLEIISRVHKFNEVSRYLDNLYSFSILKSGDVSKMQKRAQIGKMVVPMFDNIRNEMLEILTEELITFTEMKNEREAK